MAGLKNVRILNGGYTHWQEKGLQTTIIPTFFNTRSDYEITQRDTSSTIHTKALYRDYSKFRVIDARSPEEFRGEINRGEQRKGHLPGAVNVPFQQLLGASGTLKSFDDIRKMLSDLDIQKNSPIVVYCTAGVRSAHVVMVLKAAGYINVRNYTPSFLSLGCVYPIPRLNDKHQSRAANMHLDRIWLPDNMMGSLNSYFF